MAELKRRMGAGEFERWRQYYRDMPFDDEHRYYKPATMITAIAGKTGKTAEHYMGYLRPLRQEYTDADMSVFKAFGIKPKR